MARGKEKKMAYFILPDREGRQKGKASRKERTQIKMNQSRKSYGKESNVRKYKGVNLRQQETTGREITKRTR